ncbi:MAG: tetratricopeptide repeat protein, partial [Candidatus Omnitrophota bacterium]
IDRAKVYVRNVLEIEQSGQGLFQFLKFHLDRFYYEIRVFLGRVKETFVGKGRGGALRGGSISDRILFERARQKEAEGDLESALDLYQLYLKQYPGQEDAGYVMLAAAQVLIKKKSFDEAGTYLERVEKEYSGSRAAMLAPKFRSRIAGMRERGALIEHYRQTIDSEKDPALREGFEVKLGRALVANYDFKEAAEIFTVLKTSSNEEVRQQALFNLGWIYRAQNDLDLAENVLQEFLNEKELTLEMQLFLRTQLAEVLGQKGDLGRARNYYVTVQNMSKGLGKSDFADFKAWMGVSSAELAVLNYQLRDFSHLESQLKDLEAMGMTDPVLRELGNRIRTLSLSEKPKIAAFIALSQGNVSEAIVLFQKTLQAKPGDAWSLAGLATCFLILGEEDKALTLAEDAYETLPDEYTSSILAYIFKIRGEIDRALQLYQDALIHKRAFVPAQFNLASVMILKARFDEAIALLRALYEDYRTSANQVMRAKILNNLSVAYATAGNRPKALEMVQEAVRIDPELPEARNNMRLIRAGSDELEISETLMVPV